VVSSAWPFLAIFNKASPSIMTLALVALNIVVFLFEQAYPQPMIAWFALWPPGLGETPAFHLWQIATYGVLHANLTHLVIDVLGLYLFGRDLERALGRLRFVGLYAASVVAGGVMQLAVVALIPASYPSIGASAGLFGLLVAYAVLFAQRRVMPLLSFLPMPARNFAIGYAVLMLLLSASGGIPGIARFSHVGGIAGAVVCLLYWSRKASGPQ
jgi:membrane associated rhomboid family serine protease